MDDLIKSTNQMMMYNYDISIVVIGIIPLWQTAWVMMTLLTTERWNEENIYIHSQ